MNITDTIRENLRRLIGESGYRSLELFAHENSIDKTTLSRILNGKREPKISTLFKIVAALNLTLNDLYLVQPNQVREKASKYPLGALKKHKVTLLISDADLKKLQDKRHTSKSITMEMRLSG